MDNWIGNIYQKFEDINPVQYVGNQVHNVGENVKKLCSDVFQDLLPPLSGPIKAEAQEVSSERNSFINTHIGSVLANKKVPSYNVSKLPYMKSIMIDQTVNLVDDESVKHHIIDQLNTPKSLDACKESDYFLSNGKIADVLTNEKSELSNEVNGIEECASGHLEKSSHVETELVEVSHLNESNDNNIMDKYVLDELETETSKYVMESESPQFCDVVDHSKCDIGSSIAQSEMTYSVVTAAEGDNIGSSSPPSEITFSAVTAAEVDKIDSSSSASEMTFSAVVTAEVAQLSNNSSALKDSIKSLSGNSSEILSSKEDFSHDTLDKVSCVSDSPCKVLSSVPASQEEAQPVSSREENCGNSESISLTESSQGKDTKYREIAQFEACIPSVEIDDYDSGYSSMESIDLCDEVKLEESCVFVDDIALHTVSCRVQKLRSYKKRIQDIFASKKRLAKEYEQLAIWYGDSDIDSRSLTQFAAQNSQTHHACDSEWELL